MLESRLGSPHFGKLPYIYIYIYMRGDCIGRCRAYVGIHGSVISIAENQMENQTETEPTYSFKEAAQKVACLLLR